MADGSVDIQGVDYAFGAHPSPAALAAAGFRFACRYGGPGTEGKWLHADEAVSLAAAGVWVVANAEGSADGLGNGWNTGVSWAKSAQSWFRSCGMPDGRPIYFSADFDVLVDDWPAVADALRGAASVIGPDWVGVYGGYNVMRWAERDRVAKWFWQTYAWSAGRWSPSNHIEQYRNGVTIDGADCDLNRAKQADYGQWMPGLLPTTTKGQDMLLIKTATADEIYRSDGKNYWHVKDYASVQAAETAGQKVVVVQTMDQLEDLAGKPGLDEVGGIPVDELAEALAGKLDSIVEAAAERAVNKARLTTAPQG